MRLRTLYARVPRIGCKLWLSLLCPVSLCLSPAADAQLLTSSSPLPDAPGFTLLNPQSPVPQSPLRQVPSPAPTGSLTGIAKDINGAVIAGALATLTTDTQPDPRVIVSDSDGRFTFSGVAPGSFKLTVAAPGLATWGFSGLLHPDEALDLPTIALRIVSAVSDVEVVASRVDVATAQVHLEEKQRVLGVFPNFYAVYIWNAAPLTPKQKFSLAWKSATDPVTFVITGITAGVEQSQNTFGGYGQGAAGFGKRFGAAYADDLSSGMLGGAIFPTLFHQDPRYFVKGTGSVRHRALYAIATTVICKGDNGRWQPNYSNVLGNVASAGLSNLYYPAADRNGASLTIENSLIGTASGAISSLIQEFFLRKITPGVPNYGADHDKP